MPTAELLTIEIPPLFKRLCREWAGDTGCMLRAIESTGDLSPGTIRPFSHDAGRHLTDQEWHLSLWTGLSGDLSDLARTAEKCEHKSAKRLRWFEAFADETVEALRVAYGLEDSEVV
jgi:hypothetical protein